MPQEATQILMIGITLTTVRTDFADTDDNR